MMQSLNINSACYGLCQNPECQNIIEEMQKVALAGFIGYSVYAFINRNAVGKKDVRYGS